MRTSCRKTFIGICNMFASAVLHAEKNAHCSNCNSVCVIIFSVVMCVILLVKNLWCKKVAKKDTRSSKSVALKQCSFVQLFPHSCSSPWTSFATHYPLRMNQISRKFDLFQSNYCVPAKIVCHHQYILWYNYYGIIIIP